MFISTLLRFRGIPMLLTSLCRLMNGITPWFCRDYKPGRMQAASGPMTWPPASEAPLDPFATLVDLPWLPIGERFERDAESKGR
jgi:hypothetical protein